MLRQLTLPLDERGLRRAAARREWFAAQANPLELHDILARKIVCASWPRRDVLVSAGHCERRNKTHLIEQDLKSAP